MADPLIAKQGAGRGSDAGTGGCQEQAAGKRIRKKARKGILAFFCAMFCTLSLVSCSFAENGAKVVFTTGLGKNEVFRIGNARCTKAEILIYLADAQGQYERVYGTGVWGISNQGVTLEENVKETVLARTAQIKAMYLLALSKGITLDEAQTASVERAAEEYFQSLGETRAKGMDADVSTIRQMYTEYAMADQVYHYMIQGVNPEISDDEARTITVQHILLRAREEDQGVYDRISQIRELAVSEGEDFLELATRYSEDPEITYSFGKGEMDPAFEQAAFGLETGEISQVVKSEAGYHIIKCISTFDREQTDLNKLEIVEQRKKEVFGEEYDAFVEDLACQMNEKLWEEIGLDHEGDVQAVSFFQVYEKHFPEENGF